MLPFRFHTRKLSLGASIMEMILEANSSADQEQKQQNKEGVLHELMVIHHLIDKHGAVGHDFDDNREHAGKAYHRIASDLYGDDYENHPKYKDAFAKAEGTADTIRNNEGDRWKPGSTRVAWTSKHGDVEKLTGTPATQKGDSSDLYVHHPHLQGDDVYGGYSLKKTDKKNIHPPISNGGRGDVDSTLGINTDDHVNEAREKLYKKFPHLRGMTAKQAKNEIKTNNDIKNAEMEARGEMLKNISSTWGEAFKNMDDVKKTTWLREAMRANPTGYRHHRVTSGGTNGDFSHMISNPVTDHDKYLTDSKNIRTAVSGNSVRFFHVHPETKEETPLLQIRLKSSGSEGIFGSTKTSGEHYGMGNKKIDKGTGRTVNNADPIQTTAQTQHISASQVQPNK